MLRDELCSQLCSQRSLVLHPVECLACFLGKYALVRREGYVGRAAQLFMRVFARFFFLFLPNISRETVPQCGTDPPEDKFTGFVDQFREVDGAICSVKGPSNRVQSSSTRVEASLF